MRTEGADWIAEVQCARYEVKKKKKKRRRREGEEELSSVFVSRGLVSVDKEQSNALTIGQTGVKV